MVQLRRSYTGTAILLLFALGDFLALATREINSDALFSVTEESDSKDRTVVSTGAEKWNMVAVTENMKVVGGASDSIGKRRQLGEEEKLSSRCEMTHRVKPVAAASSGTARFDDLVPFSSDYRSPKYHPPKNN